METKTAIDVATEAPRAKRGNPNWVKKDVTRADVVSESPARDIWRTENCDPKLHYVFMRKNNDVEMSMAAHLQYVPARGAEKILGNPFEASQDGVGQTKERGGRILMCCPKELVEARRAARARRESARDDAQRNAAQMTRKGVAVAPISEEATRRESFG